MKPQVFALDLGSTKVACLAAEPDSNGDMKVLALSSVPCKGLSRGVVSDLEETARSIETAVRDVQQQLGKDVDGLTVSIGGTHIEGHNAQGFVPIYPGTRPINREDVLQVINHSRQFVVPPDREQIQAIPREFRIDGQRGVEKPVGMSGSKLEVVTHVITGQVTHLQNLEKAVNMAGKKIEEMVVLPLASGIAVLSDEAMELGSVVVDIGGGTTDIAVFTNGAIAYTASLPVGGMLVTSDINKLLKTTPEEAERLKLLYGSAVAAHAPEDHTVEVMQLGQTHPRPMQRRVLCEIIESRMREIAMLVRQQIEKSGLFGMLPGGVYVTGGGSKLEGTTDLFEGVLKHLRVRTAQPEVAGAFASQTASPMMSTVVGLAKFAMQPADEEIAPAAGQEGWKDKIKTLKARFLSKA